MLLNLSGKYDGYHNDDNDDEDESDDDGESAAYMVISQCVCPNVTTSLDVLVPECRF